jgi:hypothetical protein
MTRAVFLLASFAAFASFASFAGCATETAGDRPADPAEDPSADPADPSDPSDPSDPAASDTAPEATSLLWSADEVQLAEGGFTSWSDGTSLPPAAFSFGGDAIELGVFSPTVAHLSEAQPLAAPAGGAQSYWMNTNPWGDAGDRLGQGTLQVLITAATVAGAEYHVHAALGQRLDLSAPDVTVTLWASGAREAAVRTTFPTLTAGDWTAVDFFWTADRDDAEMYLLIDAQGTALTMQQVLIDEVSATW